MSIHHNLTPSSGSKEACRGTDRKKDLCKREHRKKRNIGIVLIFALHAVSSGGLLNNMWELCALKESLIELTTSLKFIENQHVHDIQ